jgi:ketosteroid isomerase-like protein
MGDKLDLRTKSIGHKMKAATLIVLVTLMACRFCSAQMPAEQEVLQFERDACKPFVNADVAGLERVLTTDFTLTDSNGEVSTRATEINELRSGKVHYDVFENYDMKGRVYGGHTAVVLGKTHVKGKTNGKPFDRIVQFTDTLVKRDGQWLVAASHVSPVKK